MKKLAISFFVVFICLTSSMANAQTQTSTTKTELKAEEILARKEKKDIDARLQAEKKANRIALRKLKGAEVSDRSKSSFSTDFKGATDVSWSRSATFDEVSFVQNGIKTTAYYDYDSNLVGTTTDKTINDLPAAALKEINKYYKDYKIERVFLFDDNEANDTDMLLYGTQFEDADHYFVEVSNGMRRVVLMVGMNGEVSYFTQL